MPSFQSRIIQHAESIIPAEFYDVREEINPKAGWYPMFGLTTVVYIISAIAFILLFINEQKNTTVETIITGYDYDGQDGYTCQMISYASATVTIPSTVDPSMEYNLVDVMESKTECETNFEQADPCNSQPLAFFPGSAAAPIPYTDGETYSAVALYGNDLSFYWMSPAPTEVYITSYNSTNGVFDAHQYSVPYETFSSPHSLAVDRNGSPVYISTDPTIDNSPMMVYRSVKDASAAEMLYDTQQFIVPTVLNDNLYNIYMFINNTFSIVDVYATPATNTVLFTLAEGTNIVAAAVYHDGVSPLVYYVLGGDERTVWTYYDGVTNSTVWDVGGYDSNLMRLVVDGNNYMYALVVRRFDGQSVGQGEYVVMRQVNESNIFTSAISTETVPPRGFAINPSGSRMMLTTLPPEEGALFGYVYTEHPVYTDAGNPFDIVRSQTGFGGGFFMCENQVVSPTAYTPGAIAEYPQACETNGIEGKIVYNQKYTFSSTDMQTYATTNAVQFCPNLFAPIIAKVSKLPPYSCSRTLHQSFLSCFGTAFANMSFLMQIMVFACAMWLPRLAARYPVEAETEERKSVAHRKSMVDNRNSVAGANGTSRETNDIEMGAVPGEVNPMQYYH